MGNENGEVHEAQMHALTFAVLRLPSSAVYCQRKGVDLIQSFRWHTFGMLSHLDC